jgi:RNA polymerase sigma-B factor
MTTTRNRPDHHHRETTTRRLFDEAADARAPRRGALLDEVVLLNRPVAESVARRFRGRGIDDDDLRQVACEGLVKAVHRFDPGLGKDLLTFAVPTIRGELQRHFRDHGWAVRPTRAVQEAQWRVAGAEERLAQELGRQPSRDEVCESLGLSRDDYAAAMSAEGCFHPTSLDQPAGEHTESTTIGDFLADESRDHDAAEARVMLAPVVSQLSARARRVLYLRYFDGLTQGEIGREIGVTQTQVSRILTEVLATLRHQLAGVVEPVALRSGQPAPEPVLPLSA